MTNTYTEQAEKFLKDTKTTFKAELIGHGHYFEDDKDTRDIYQITLSREGKKPYTFRFGQSIKDSGPSMKENYKISKEFYRSHRAYPMKPQDYEQRRVSPTAYDVLACVQKYDVGTFEDFCSEFGYDTDSRKAEKMYFSVQNEHKEINRLFHDVMDKLQEIQ